MEYKTYEKNGYQVVKVLEDISFNTDLSILKDLTKQFLEQSKKNLAFCFHPADTYLNSAQIGCLVVCIEMTNDYGGNISIVTLSQEIVSAIKVIGLAKYVTFVESEDDLKIP